MKQQFSAFRMFLQQIWDDIMLAAVLFVPIILGVVFRFGVPKLESVLCRTFDCVEILAPYYQLFDLTILLVTPIMFAYAGVMVVLEEIDNGIARYLSVTPLGKGGYLFSRIVSMSLIAGVYGGIVTRIFRLSSIHGLQIVLASLLSILVGILISFGIIGFAHNKVEGLALSKFSAIFLLGFFVPVFIVGTVRYAAAFLPTFWMMEYCYYKKVSALIVSVFLCIVYILMFYRKVEEKLNR